jgi:hypothetical protein
MQWLLLYRKPHFVVNRRTMFKTRFRNYAFVIPLQHLLSEKVPITTAIKHLHPEFLKRPVFISHTPSKTEFWTSCVTSFHTRIKVIEKCDFLLCFIFHVYRSEWKIKGFRTERKQVLDEFSRLVTALQTEILLCYCSKLFNDARYFRALLDTLTLRECD